ncbi:Pentatricopeptide repeat-containing protein [Rhynchospora pubera]|uniref:Pentatricopeptide repeat-containing protein n=1 Tax=Rhynchospora pubera TaxID=906938 RepID=A0AAV8GXA1_9POAL|nr:Pentatricopeptide repeat-containing protein [Rhynchospora pubera]KAJ4807866.1 Pentatricopeptide repeat-containing protein [Rhynchospora pubera]
MDLSLTPLTFTPIGVQRSWNRRAELVPTWIRPIRCHAHISDSSDTSTGKANLDSDWSQDELDAISALFERPLPPQNYTKQRKERALPLPQPHKVLSIDQTPTPKRHIRSVSKAVLAPRSSFTDQVRKNPEVLIAIAREIQALDSQSDVSEVLDRWAPFLRKGSLSMTIRELGHMGLSDRVLQTLCWVQKRRQGSKSGPALVPDDRIFASAVEVLARFNELKIESELDKWILTATRPILESMAKGFIKAGELNLARKVMLLAKDKNRKLDPSVHAKLILAAGHTSNTYKLAKALIQELGERDDFDLSPQDCTAIMKVCIKLGMFETVEHLFQWYKERSTESPTIVMYTTVIHSRYCDSRYREAMALVWELESQNYLLDLPAYRVVIRLCVALNDLERAMRYFTRLKEAGFNPSYDMYRYLIRSHALSGRYWMCKQLKKELELGGMRLDKELEAFFMQLDG